MNPMAITVKIAARTNAARIPHNATTAPEISGEMINAIDGPTLTTRANERICCDPDCAATIDCNSGCASVPMEVPMIIGARWVQCVAEAAERSARTVTLRATTTV